MALFICSKYPDLDITVKPERKKHDNAGNTWVEQAESVKFRNKRLQLDDIEDKDHIASLRKHRDYNIVFHELDISKYEAKLKAASEPDPIMHNCNYCGMELADSKSLSAHRAKCPKNPKVAKGKEDELQAANSKHVRGVATTVNRVAPTSDPASGDKQ